MTSSSQVLSLLIGVAVLSGFSVLIYLLQEALNVNHQQRLKILKANLILTWIVPTISFVIIYSRAGRAIGSLLPVSENLNRALAASNARVMIFQSENFQFSQIVLGFYLIGLSVMVIRFIVAYLKMRSLLLNSSANNINGCLVRMSHLTTSPFSFGFLNPQIFIPSFLMEKSEKAVEVMLAHEETHVRHRDPQWKLISLMTRILLFFTPTALYLHLKMELEMEIECDRVTINKTQVSVGEYGNFLIDTAALIQDFKPNPMFTYMSDTNLRRRIQAMKAKTFNRPVLSAVFGSCVLIAGLTAVAAVTGVSKLKGQYHVKADILLNGKIVSSPQFTVLQSEPASIEMKSDNPPNALRMQLTASDSENTEVPQGIDLKIAIEYKNQDESIRANPRMIVMPGEDGLITLGSNSGDILEIKIKAERR